MTDMTDQELARLMRHVLMDGIGQEAEQTSQQDIPAFQPSPRYQRQMAAMQRDPLAWSRKKQRPAWKKWAQTAAALLLALRPALVWAAFPLSELISCFAAALLYRRTIQKQLL